MSNSLPITPPFSGLNKILPMHPGRELPVILQVLLAEVVTF